MSPETSHDSVTPSPALWQQLWRDLAFAGSQQPRPLPDCVEIDLVKLRGIENGTAASSPQAEPDKSRVQLASYVDNAGVGNSSRLQCAQPEAEARKIVTLMCDRLTMFLEDVQFMETHQLADAPHAAEAHKALYAYLCSKRDWGEFRGLERVLSRGPFKPLVERVFARDAAAFLADFDNRWRDQRPVAEFDKFTRLVEQSIQAWDLPSLRALWTTLYNRVGQGVNAEETFAHFGRLIVGHERVVASELRDMLADLTRHPLPDNRMNGLWLAKSGRILARRSYESTSSSSDDVRSDLRVEFGFLSERISQLFKEPRTPENQARLVGLYRRAATYAAPSDHQTTQRAWAHRGLGAIRRHAIQSLYHSETDSREIIEAAMPLLKDSCRDSAGIIFGELLEFEDASQRQLAVDVLRELLVVETVASQFRHQCTIRSGSSFRKERAKLVELFRDALASERQKLTGRNGIYITRLFGLLGSLCEEARAAVPDALKALGIESIDLGRFGFIENLLDRGKDKDPDPAVRAAASRFLRQWERVLKGTLPRRFHEVHEDRPHRK